ncbi:MAG TPA: Gfo/Idh/MocA family oxidoreductase [Acidobacteriaceae bacterium]|nr:Gfo/Idh/MocA family oxidoreductase [Acidobacteriaceae bacterium]
MASASPQSIGFAIIGVGAFGSSHLRVIRELSAAAGDTVRLAAIVESDSGRRQALQADLPQACLFPDIDACLAARAAGQIELHAASICAPTSAHAAIAGALLQSGIDVLVEKPIAASLAEADALVDLAARHHRILQVGHLERFNPAVLAVQPYIHMPMFFEAHRLSVFTPRSLDVDVVLDLMVHDLDIVLSLVQSPIRSLQAVGLPVLSRKVDIANVRVEFASGCVANFTASRVSTERVRKLRFFQPHQYISIDYARQDLLFIDVKPQAASDAAPPDPARILSGLALSKPAVTPGEPLRLEIESFLESVRTRQQPRVTGQQGRAALALALDINAAIAEHAARAQLDRFV